MTVLDQMQAPPRPEGTAGLWRTAGRLAAEGFVPALAVIAAISMASTLDGAPRGARMGPDIVVIAVAVLAAALLVRAFVGLVVGRRNRAEETSGVGDAQPYGGLTRLLHDGDVRRQAIVLAVMATFPAAVWGAGFLVASLAFIAVVALLCGAKPLHALVLSAGMAGLVLGGMRAVGFHFPL